MKGQMRIALVALCAAMAAVACSVSDVVDFGEVSGVDDGASEGTFKSVTADGSQEQRIELKTGAAITVPKGALDKVVEITMERPEDTKALTLVKSLKNQDAIVSAPYVLTPHGTTFKTSITIELPVNKKSDKKLVVGWLKNESDTTWKRLGEPTVKDGVAKIDIDHFSVVILLEEETADLPDSGGEDGEPESGVSPSVDAETDPVDLQPDAAVARDGGGSASDASSDGMDAQTNPSRDAGLDAGADFDGGAALDAGADFDAALDAGAALDAETQTADAGAVSADAGASDAGSDAGQVVDSGPADAGPVLVHGLTGFDGINVLATGLNAGLRGSTGGHWLRILHRVETQAVPSIPRFLASHFTGGEGHFVMTGGANQSLMYRPLFTGLQFVDSPTLAITPSMVGALIDSVFVWDQPSGRVRHYYQGVEVGTGTSTGLSFVPAPNERFFIGVRGNGDAPADANSIYAVEGGDGYVPTPSEIAAAHAETVSRVSSGADPFAGTGGSTTLATKITWSANAPHSWTPPTLDDTAPGNQDMSIVAGSATGIAPTVMSPSWAP